MRKKGLCVALALGLLSACGKKIPDDIIQPGAMEDLFCCMIIIWLLL